MRRWTVPLLAAPTIGIWVAGGGAPAGHAEASGLHTIQHVIVIMQENRSFDSMFGTYPGVDGIPRDAGGTPTVCVPDPWSKQCVRPYHDSNDVNKGGPHQYENAVNDIDGGRMDGFIGEYDKSIQGQYEIPGTPTPPLCPVAGAPTCRPSATDVMGYHDRHELPVYWSYADQYVIQDHMYEPVQSWSLPAHLAMVSGWSAACTNPNNPMRCSTDLEFPDGDGTSYPVGAQTLPYSGGLGAFNGMTYSSDSDDGNNPTTPPDFAWTDLTYLLHRNHVSWAYYVTPGQQPDCANGQTTCVLPPQNDNTPEIWNPLPDFQTVHADRELGNIQDVSRFYTAARTGQLPAVTWVIPSQNVSDHPPAALSDGQRYVKGLIDAVMNGPSWSSSAIFVSWDDWGGFYDHVNPPTVDGQQYGLRVPGLVISPYARRHYIDHRTLSHDAYLRFIEDDFLGGQRIDPRTDGRPDSRPSVREAATGLGDLVNDFDFSQNPSGGGVAAVASAPSASSSSPNTAAGAQTGATGALLSVVVARGVGRLVRRRRRLCYQSPRRHLDVDPRRPLVGAASPDPASDGFRPLLSTTSTTL